MKILAIGAHTDDVEISCAGTLIKCVKRGDEVFRERKASGRQCAARLLP